MHFVQSRIRLLLAFFTYKSRLHTANKHTVRGGPVHEKLGDMLGEGDLAKVDLFRDRFTP